jgi:hypothetical protein
MDQPLVQNAACRDLKQVSGRPETQSRQRLARKRFLLCRALDMRDPLEKPHGTVAEGRFPERTEAETGGDRERRRI